MKIIVQPRQEGAFARSAHTPTAEPISTKRNSTHEQKIQMNFFLKGFRSQCQPFQRFTHKASLSETTTYYPRLLKMLPFRHLSNMKSWQLKEKARGGGWLGSGTCPWFPSEMSLKMSPCSSLCPRSPQLLPVWSGWSNSALEKSSNNAKRSKVQLESLMRWKHLIK